MYVCIIDKRFERRVVLKDGLQKIILFEKIFGRGIIVCIYKLKTKVLSWSIDASMLLIKNLFEKIVTAFCPLPNAMSWL